MQHEDLTITNAVGLHASICADAGPWDLDANEWAKVESGEPTVARDTAEVGEANDSRSALAA